MMQRKDERLMQAIALRLRELRSQRGLSQYTVYMDTDLNIGNLELGRTNITVSTLSILCNYYGLTLEEFFKGL